MSRIKDGVPCAEILSCEEKLFLKSSKVLASGVNAKRRGSPT